MRDGNVRSVRSLVGVCAASALEWCYSRQCATVQLVNLHAISESLSYCGRVSPFRIEGGRGDE